MSLSLSLSFYIAVTLSNDGRWLVELGNYELDVSVDFAIEQAAVDGNLDVDPTLDDYLRTLNNVADTNIFLIVDLGGLHRIEKILVRFGEKAAHATDGAPWW